MRLSGGVGPACAGAVLLVCGLTGCAANCTLIGADPGVMVTLSGSGWDTPLTVQACVATTCGELPDVRDTKNAVFIRNTAVSSGRPTDVVVTVHAQDGAVTVPATRTSVTPTKLQPNGPECGPTVWIAALTIPRP